MKKIPEPIGDLGACLECAVVLDTEEVLCEECQEEIPENGELNGTEAKDN